MKRTFFSLLTFVFVIVVYFISSLCYAGIVHLPSQVQSVAYQSGTYSGNSATYSIAYSATISSNNASWLQLRLNNNTSLGKSSYLEIISKKDSSKQYIGPRELLSWKHHTAFFNGESVFVNLVVAPNDTGIRFAIDSIRTGLGIDSLISENCFTDTRIQNDDPRIGRIIGTDDAGNVGWATAFIIGNGNLITAGHVAELFNDDFILEFNFELSNEDGVLQHPPAEDQYIVDTLMRSSSSSPGNDWCVFNVFSSSGKTPIERQGNYFLTSDYIVPNNVKIIGCGVSEADDSPRLNGYPVSTTGPFIKYTNSLLEFSAFAKHGMSGGPILDAAYPNIAIGILTHGCTLHENTRGTSFNHVGLSEFSKKKIITVDQILSDEESNGINIPLDELRAPRSAGIIGIWSTGGIPYPVWSYHTAPVRLPVDIDSHEYFLADSTVITDIYSYKFHHWNNSHYGRFADFIIKGEIGKFTSNLIRTYQGITLTNCIINQPDSGGTIEFKDPWLFDTTVVDKNRVRSNPILTYDFKERSSPFRPNFISYFENTKYNGVFLKQTPDPDESYIPYYSVRAKLTQIINGFACVFHSWSTTPEHATFYQVEEDPEGYSQRAVNFLSGNAVVKARYTAEQATPQTNIFSGWKNIVSIPVGMSNYAVKTVFPSSRSSAYRFDTLTQTYKRVDTLKYGVGYWIKYQTDSMVSFSGGKRVLDTITLKAGWNLISSLSVPLLKGQIVTLPANIIVTIQGMKSSGYYQADTLLPGRGYWVNASQAGKMILNSYEHTDEQYQYSNQNYSIALVPSFPPQDTVLLVSPSNNITNVNSSLQLSWNKTAYSDSFRIQIDTDSNFASPIYRTITGITDTQYTVTGLSSSSTYYWRVKRLNVDLGEGTYSSKRKFTTGTIPQAPSLISPSNAITNQSLPVTFRWNGITGATSYHLYAIDWADNIMINNDITDTIYMASNLLPNTQYFWSVYATNSFGDGDQSQEFHFTTSASAPDISLVSQNVSVNGNLHPKLSWSSVSGGGSYILYRRDCSFGSSYPCGTETQVYSSASTLEYTDMNAFIPPKNGPQPNITYYYKVVKGTKNSNALGINGRVESKIGVTETEPLPAVTALLPAYPNPFNPITMIRYQLSASMPVTVKLYSTIGIEVATIVNEYQESGQRNVVFNGNNLPSGVYFVRLSAGKENFIQKIMLTK